MPRIAIQLNENLIAGIGEMFGVEDPHVFGDHTYAVVEMKSETEFTFKLMTEDEIVDAAQSDSELQIISI